MTEGARLVAELLEHRSASDLAAVLDVSVQAVLWWSRGRSKPRPATRQKLAEVFGVPVEAWLQEPAPQPQKRASRKKTTTPRSALERAQETVVLAEEHLRGLLAKGRAAPREVAGCMTALGQAVKVLADLEGEQEQRAQRAIATLETLPEWQVLKSAMARACTLACPQCRLTFWSELRGIVRAGQAELRAGKPAPDQAEIDELADALDDATAQQPRAGIEASPELFEELTDA